MNGYYSRLKAKHKFMFIIQIPVGDVPVFYFKHTLYIQTNDK